MSLALKYRSGLFIRIAGLFFTLWSQTNAQITNVTNDQATPIPGSGHDYIKMLSETVEPSNGQLSIRIEVPTRPTRGVQLPFAYLYNSAGVHHVVPLANGKAQWVSDTADTQGSGWSNTLPSLSTLQAVSSTNYPGPPPFTASCVYFTQYVFQDPAGARHALPIQTAQSTDPSSPNRCSQVTSPPSNVLLGGDGTYNASTTAPTADTVPTGPTPATVVGPDGTTYTFPGLPLVFNGWTVFFRGTAGTIEDRNGNIISPQQTISVTTISETVPWQKFAFNSVPASGNPTQASCFGIANGSGQLNVNQSINFPNGKAYQLQYDPTYGLVSQITYPTGGYVKYAWGLNPLSENVFSTDFQGLPCNFEYDTPAITNRYVSFDGVNIALEQDFHYSPTQWNPNGLWTSKQTIVTTIDCARNNFNCSGAPSFTTTYNYVPTGGLFGGQNAVEASVVYGDFAGVTRVTDTKGWAGFGLQMVCELKTLDNGLISGAFFTYGSGNQITDKKEYDYRLITSTSGCITTNPPATAPSGVSLTRETVVTYQSFPSTPIFPAAASIFDRPCDVAIHISSQSSAIADTHYLYDGGTSNCGSPGTGATASVGNLLSGTHDETNYGPTSTAPRGNAIKIDRTCLPGCGHVVSTASFDETGQVLSVTDACGNATCSDMSGSNHTTTYSYADSFTDSAPSGNTNTFLTKITYPTTSNGVGHSESFKYSYASGQLTFATDQNGQPTQYVYNDSLFRPTEIDYPDGGKTTFSYNDSPPNPSVTTTKAMTSSTNLVTVTTSDGLGHPIETLLTSDPDCASGDRTDTTYNGLGRVRTVSNPYCTATDTTYGITTYAYDALGRTTQVTRQDGATALTTYSGRATQVQDEGNGTQRVTRISQTDGLGRLTSVCEVAPGPFVGAGGASSSSLIGSAGTPAPCGQDISGTGFLTTYQYDTLDNLLQVKQTGVGNRTFNYDSLSRLLCASNPENSSAPCPASVTVTYTSGTTGYAYDANGNMATKTAPAPNSTSSSTVTTTNTYDALNRLSQKSYSDGTTPTVILPMMVVPQQMA